MLRAVASQILSGTWANKPSSAANSSIYFASDVGESGTYFHYNGTRWVVLNGESSLKSLGASVTGITNTEQIVLQALLPAGSWQQYDCISLKGLSFAKTGTTDNFRITVRVGTAGTTADTAITGLSAFTVIATTSASGGFDFDIRLLSATSAQKTGNNANQASAFGAASGTAAAAATTITDASANALYISVGLSSSGTTDTGSITGGRIKLITP